MFEMDLHCSFGHLKHKLWAKERSGVKLLVMGLQSRGTPNLGDFETPIEESWDKKSI
jgi:hypothetical protein